MRIMLDSMSCWRKRRRNCKVIDLFTDYRFIFYIPIGLKGEQLVTVNIGGCGTAV